jgi:peptidoglycan/LPS O-acetylase OafA/YrhL
MGIAYRREIDGLRALAVSAVVLYHARVGGAGFVGVDIFFVISGYLITALLLREHQATGRIDLFDFYGRRVRRIFPAATVVVLATLGAASLLLPREEFTRVSDSAAAAAAFVANFFFQGVTGGYFDARSTEMPLLHLWSLSVEEQFYLAWPALLIALLRRGRVLPVLGAFALLSFIAAEILMRVDPEAAFYQMPARFWELAAGGIVASLPVRAVPRWLASAGLLLAAGACVFAAPHFPGTGALTAVTGAAILIYAIHCGAQQRLLASAPVVGIGLVSYSLYLWHWPLLAFYRATSIGEGSTSVRLQLIAVALLLALASYRYVEQPFRRMRFPSRMLVAGGAAGSLVLALGACALGIAGRRAIEQSPEIGNVLAFVTANDHMPGEERCDYAGAGDIGPVPRPTCGSPRPRMALWGDSLGSSWQPFAWELAAREGLPVTAFHMAGCPALLGFVPSKGAARDEHCAEFNRRAAAALKGMDTVVIVVHWAQWLDKDGAEEGLVASLDAASGARRILLIGVTPDLKDFAPRCIERRSHGCDLSRAEFEARAKPLRQALARAAAGRANVEIVDPADFLCTPQDCPTVKEGVGLYTDDRHLTATAATAFALDYLQTSRALH